MIWDCFTYFNEEDVLRIRLEEHYDKVDRFLLVEGDSTFSGQPKPYYFDALPRWIEDFEDKIVRVFYIFDDDDDLSPWDREYAQRNIIGEVMKDRATKSDVILISDVDEIINIDALPEYSEPVRLDNTQFFWTLNWQVPKACNTGARPVMVSVDDLRKHTAQELRASNDLATVDNGGWHFSFLGNANKAVTKISAYAHSEYDTDEYRDIERLNLCAKKGLDPFFRFPLKYRPISDHTHPLSLVKNQSSYRHLINQIASNDV